MLLLPPCQQLLGPMYVHKEQYNFVHCNLCSVEFCVQTFYSENLMLVTPVLRIVVCENSVPFLAQGMIYMYAVLAVMLY